LPKGIFHSGFDFRFLHGATTSTNADDPRGARWSVEVDEIHPGEVSIEPAFRIAIYENVLREVAKAKTFQQVFS
jgi:hypothetical protein